MALFLFCFGVLQNIVATCVLKKERFLFGNFQILDLCLDESHVYPHVKGSEWACSKKACWTPCKLVLQSLIVYRISPLPFVCLFVYFCITLLITDKQLEGYWVPWETLAWDIHPRINQISWAVLGLSGAVKQNGPRDLTERKFSVLVLCFLCPRLASFLLNGPCTHLTRLSRGEHPWLCMDRRLQKHFCSLEMGWSSHSPLHTAAHS